MTHQRQFVALCDRVVVLRDGAVIASGRAADVAGMGLPEITGDEEGAGEGRRASLEGVSLDVIDGAEVEGRGSGLGGQEGGSGMPGTPSGREKRGDEGSENGDALMNGNGNAIKGVRDGSGGVGGERAGSRAVSRAFSSVKDWEARAIQRAMSSAAEREREVEREGEDVEDGKNGKLVVQEGKATGSVSGRVYLAYAGYVGAAMAWLLMAMFAVGQGLMLGQETSLALVSLRGS